MGIQSLGQYGHQVALSLKEQDRYKLSQADIRITPEEISETGDSLQFSQKALENIMAYTQEDMKTVDGNLPGESPDGVINRSELQHYFRDGFDTKILNKIADHRTQQFMTAFDRGNGQGGGPDGQLTLDELAARQIVELAPRQAFSQVISDENAASPVHVEDLEALGLDTRPGLSFSAVELALNSVGIDDTSETIGVSTPNKRTFVANQFEADPEKIGEAADKVMKDYDLINLANKFKN